MSLKLKTGFMQVREDGVMKDIDMLVGDAAVNIKAIEDKGKEVLDSIPDSYHELTDEFDSLKDEIVTKKSEATENTRIAYQIDLDEYTLLEESDLGLTIVDGVLCMKYMEV